MGHSLKVLIGDFDRARSLALEAGLGAQGLEVERVENGVEVLERCRESKPHVVVMDVLMPRMNGLEVLKAIKEEAATSETRVVLLLDADDDYGEQRGRLCGADAILRRPVDADAVGDAVRTAVREASLRGKDDSEVFTGGLEAVVDAMEGRARQENPLLAHITDPLTGLYNRPYLELKLSEEFKKARRFSLPLACASVALDAEDLGDVAQLRSALNEIAGLLLCESRDIDLLARLEGSSFFLLLPHTDSSGAAAMVARILRAVEARGFERVNGQVATASAGIAAFGSGPNLDGPEDFLRRTHEALQVSRRWGGNRVTVWTGETEPSPR